MQLSPYRRATDNRIAVFSRWLVFLWAFGLLLRLDGILGSMPSVIVGLALVIATLAVVEEALRLSITEMRQDLKTRRRESAANDEEAEELDSSAVTEQDRNDDRTATETEAGLDDAVAGRGAPNEDSSFWARMLGPSLLCMSQSQQLDNPDAVASGDNLAAELLSMERLLAEKDQTIANQVQALSDKDDALAAKDDALTAKDKELSRLHGAGHWLS